MGQGCLARRQEARRSAQKDRKYRSMAEEVISLRNKLRNNFTPSLGEETSRYLRNWLTDHILVEDKKSAQYLQV